jgi:hypothetical protein
MKNYPKLRMWDCFALQKRIGMRRIPINLPGHKKGVMVMMGVTTSGSIIMPGHPMKVECVVPGILCGVELVIIHVLKIP